MVTTNQKYEVERRNPARETLLMRGFFELGQRQSRAFYFRRGNSKYPRWLFHLLDADLLLRRAKTSCIMYSKNAPLGVTAQTQCCTTAPENVPEFTTFRSLISEIRNGRNGRNQCRNFRTRDFPMSEIPESVSSILSVIPNSEPKASGIPNLDLRIPESHQKSGGSATLRQTPKGTARHA